MTRPAFSILIATSLLLASGTIASAQQGSAQNPEYVDVGRDFRQANQVTMGADLLTPEEQSRFAAMRQQAKTSAEKDRVEAEESALLNQRVSERINAALNQPISPGTRQAPSTAERPDRDRSGPGASGATPRSSEGIGSGRESGGMGSSDR